MNVDIRDLRFPYFNESRDIPTWHPEEMDREDAPEYVEAYRLDHPTDPPVIVTRNGWEVGVVVDGQVIDEYGLRERADEIREDLDESGEYDLDAVNQLEQLADALEQARDEGTGYQQAEGPMMNYWYPIGSDYVDDVEAWASAIVDLPLCAVVVDGVAGLALTGGGMNLSWEIAEAFIRCGFLPPLGPCSDLPQMAGMKLDATKRTVLQALQRHLQVEADSYVRAAARLRERYGVGPIPE